MRLRLAEFNVENLFLFIDRFKNQDIRRLTESEWQSLSCSIIPNKPLQKVLQLARAVRDIDPDLLMLCEVGGLESLENFNRLFLDNAYLPQFIEGNSERGIDICYLVRSTLKFKYDLRSHRHRPIHFLYPHENLSNMTGYTAPDGSVYKSHRFSRDVLELRIYHESSQEPVLINLLVHLKSKWDRDGYDPDGRDRRRAELKALVGIYRELQEEFQGRVPVLISGDFNGHAGRTNTDEEFSSLYQETDLQDCLEIAGRELVDRTTYVQIYQSGKSLPSQLDYIFVPEKLRAALIPQETYVYRFQDEWKLPYMLPLNMTMKRELPSDHYPVVTTLDLSI